MLTVSKRSAPEATSGTFFYLTENCSSLRKVLHFPQVAREAVLIDDHL